MATRYSHYGSTQYSERHPAGSRSYQTGPTSQRNNRVKTDRRLKAELTARDFMEVCAETLRPEDSIELAARHMSRTECGAVPVVDGSGRLIGLITDKDITVKLLAPGASIPHAQVSDCMSSEAFACSGDTSLEGCLNAMAWHGIDRISVVDDEHRVLGTIGQRDLARHLCERPERVQRRMIAGILGSFAGC